VTIVSVKRVAHRMRAKIRSLWVSLCEERVVFIMHADVGASEAYQHTGHFDFAVAIVGSTLLAVVVLESCSHHGQ